MSRVCPLTGKKPTSGNNRSHSLRATRRRRWGVNLQKVKIDGKTYRVSARAMRTLRKADKDVAVAAEAAE